LINSCNRFVLTLTEAVIFQAYGPNAVGHNHPDYYIKKPFGFSYFPKELIPVPIIWAKQTGDLMWSKIHEKGGHFAALEEPEELLADVEEWMKAAWKK
jgi:microsomal epoxide hydrolase